MALSELAALEAAYQVLEPLDLAGRRRALQWLSDALGAEAPLTAQSPSQPADGRATAEPAAASTPTRRRAKRAPAPATRPSRTPSARRARKAQVEEQSQGRAYRRMPPADEVMASYEEIGSISGLADHYGVPRHTAQGWARQLRRHGHSIGRTR
jgi:hypothetical protein